MSISRSISRAISRSISRPIVKSGGATGPTVSVIGVPSTLYDGAHFTDIATWGVGAGTGWGRQASAAPVLDWGGLGFDNIPCSNAANIISATITGTIAITDPTAGTAVIRAEDVDDIPGSLSGRTAPSTWTLTTAQVTGVQYTATGPFSEDVTAIVQEIVDRVGWAANNGMTFVFDPTGGGWPAGFISTAFANLNPVLTVTWEP